MAIGQDNLAVRQHERYRCALGVGLVMAPQHADILRLSPNVVDARNTVRAVMTDCSFGGLGLNVGVFFPKRALIVMTHAPDGGPAIELLLRVMRVQMVDRQPTYYLGMGLADAQDEANDAALRRLIEITKATPSVGKEIDCAGA